MNLSFRNLSLIACVTTMSLCTSLPDARAQDSTASVQAPSPSDLTNIEQAIGASAARQKELEESLAAAAQEAAELSERLVNQAQLVTSQEQALAKAETRIGKLKTEIAKLNLELAGKQDVLSEILAGLQQLEQNPPPALVVKPNDVLGALRSAMMFGAVIPELRGEAVQIEIKLSQLHQLQEDLTAEAKGHSEMLASLANARAEAKNLINEKKALAKASQLDLDAERKRAEQLAEKAKTLKQLLASLEEARLKAAAEQTAAEKARAEIERREQEKRRTPAIAFSLAKGQLAYPAQGQVFRDFGADNGLGGKLDGIIITTGNQAQVTAPADSKVEFAGPFMSYDKLVILNAGEGYLVLLAGMSQILAETGQSVRAGEPVGLMGDHPAEMAVANGLTNQPSPVLYVEFRKSGTPIDPTPWWAGNKQEAMR